MPKPVRIARLYQDKVEASSSLFASHIVLPSQSAGVFGLPDNLSPSQNLMFAVFESAVHDLQRYCGATEKWEKRLFCEAQEWFLSRDEHYVFSFVMICHVLELDPDTVCRHLSVWPDVCEETLQQEKSTSHMVHRRRMEICP
jgi:hypothetical protein